MHFPLQYNVFAKKEAKKNVRSMKRELLKNKIIENRRQLEPKYKVFL